jgi:hypothetical protein
MLYTGKINAGLTHLIKTIIFYDKIITIIISYKSKLEFEIVTIVLILILTNIDHY